MSKPKLERNKKIVELRDSNPKAYSFKKLGEIFNISKEWAYAVYLREKERAKEKSGVKGYPHSTLARR